MLRTHHCGALRIEHTGAQVTLSGWVQRTRDLGGMTFVDLRDRYGITQLAFNTDTDTELCEQARKLGREFVIQIKGKVIELCFKSSLIFKGNSMNCIKPPVDRRIGSKFALTKLRP